MYKQKIILFLCYVQLQTYQRIKRAREYVWLIDVFDSIKMQIDSFYIARFSVSIYSFVHQQIQSETFQKQMSYIKNTVLTKYWEIRIYL